MRKSETYRNEIKSYIVRAGMTMTELRHLPAATYEWYSKNYLDRDYPLRFILMCNGVEFPDTPEEDK